MGYGYGATATALAAPGTNTVVRFALGLVTADSATLIPAGAVVMRARLRVTATYSPGATIEIGTPAFPSLFQLTTDNNPQTPTPPDIFETEPDLPLGAGSVVRATVAGAPAAGAAFVEVEFASPLP